MNDAVGTLAIRTGFKQIPHRGTGMLKLHDRLASTLCRDRKAWPHVMLRPWNADTDTDAELVRQAGAGRHIEIAYSYGAGQGLSHFGPSLAKLCPDKPIDLAILIDPVTRWRWAKWRALKHGGAFAVPPNVRRVAIFRTVNQPSWDTPVGHDLKLTSDRTQVVANVVYGSARELAKHVPDITPKDAGSMQPRLSPGRVTNDELHHSNIDDYEPIHDQAVALIESLLAGDIP